MGCWWGVKDGTSWHGCVQQGSAQHSVARLGWRCPGQCALAFSHGICPPACLLPAIPHRPAEYCAHGSLCNVLRDCAASPQAAQAAEMTWQRRLGMVGACRRLHARASRLPVPDSERLPRLGCPCRACSAADRASASYEAVPRIGRHVGSDATMLLLSLAPTSHHEPAASHKHAWTPFGTLDGRPWMAPRACCASTGRASCTPLSEAPICW